MVVWQPIQKRWVVGVLFLVVLGLGWYLRLAHQPETFFFQNDIGRDYLVLWEWIDEGAFPWLGPLNSAIAFNQSPWYFYLLLPFFLTTAGNLYTTTLAWLVLVTAVSTAAVWQNRQKPWLLSSLLSVSSLVAVYPLLVNQTRTVWNPSFVLPLLVIAYLSFLSVLNDRKWRWVPLLVCGGAVGLSMGVHLSSVPALLPLAFVIVVVFRWQSLWLLASSIASILVVFGPNLIFDATHGWQIIRRLVSHGLYHTVAGDVTLTIWQKFGQLGGTVFSGMRQELWLGLLCLLAATVAYEVWRAGKAQLGEYRERLLIISSCLLCTTALILFSPIAIQAHYVFGVAALFFLVIAVLRTKVMLIFTLVLAVFWLQPAVTAQYRTPAPRTYAQLMQCFQTFCAAHPEPLYISVVAGFHEYHYGPEFLYLMKRNGCTAQKLEVLTDSAERMVVVADQTTYTHGVSEYYELGLLGPSEVVAEQQCSGGVALTVLEQVK